MAVQPQFGPFAASQTADVPAAAPTEEEDEASDNEHGAASCVTVWIRFAIVRKAVRAKASGFASMVKLMRGTELGGERHLAVEIGNRTSEGVRLGCPRKCVFDIRGNTEFFEKHTEFRGIPRNSAVFFAVKSTGIPRNSVCICIRNSACK